MTSPRARLLAILKEPDSVTFQNYVREPGDNRNVAVEDWCARHRLKRLCEETAQFVRGDVYKERYRTWPALGDGNRSEDSEISKMCAQLADAILALGEDDEHP